MVVLYLHNSDISIMQPASFPLTLSYNWPVASLIHRRSHTKKTEN